MTARTMPTINVAVAAMSAASGVKSAVTSTRLPRGRTPKPVELYLTGSISSSTTWNKQPSWSTRQDSRSVAHGNETFGCPNAAGAFAAKDAAAKVGLGAQGGT